MLLTISEAAERLRCSPITVADKRFRKRVGLVATKIGKKVLFRSEDIETVIRKGSNLSQKALGDDSKECAHAQTGE